MTDDEALYFNKLTLDQLKALAARVGYTFKTRETETHVVQEMYRPDGTLAIRARKRKERKIDEV